MYGLRGNDLVKGIEADIGNQGDDPDQQCPIYPNWGLDWIICGRPSCGPCVE